MKKLSKTDKTRNKRQIRGKDKQEEAMRSKKNVFHLQFSWRGEAYYTVETQPATMSTMSAFHYTLKYYHGFVLFTISEWETSSVQMKVRRGEFKFIINHSLWSLSNVILYLIEHHSPFHSFVYIYFKKSINWFWKCFIFVRFLLSKVVYFLISFHYITFFLCRWEKILHSSEELIDHFDRKYTKSHRIQHTCWKMLEMFITIEWDTS